LEINTNNLTINHIPLEYNTQYYITISSSAIESTTGTPFAGISLNTDWAFTTETQAPNISSTNPTNGDSGVLIGQDLTITFDTDIQFSDAFNRIRVRRYTDNSIYETFVVEGVDTDPTLSISARTLTISHIDFEYNTRYYVTIGDGAIESTGGTPFSGFADNATWNFT
ncbi:Ig-like domain-containing protein, partial [Labilibacter marinus]|uniref:Ig-like domain-containing protein n=1 Tax=Labilibacter marinus TaxID=1477105 RepID=UPI0018E9B66D